MWRWSQIPYQCHVPWTRWSRRTTRTWSRLQRLSSWIGRIIQGGRSRMVRPPSMVNRSLCHLTRHSTRRTRRRTSIQTSLGAKTDAVASVWRHFLRMEKPVFVKYPKSREEPSCLKVAVSFAAVKGAIRLISGAKSVKNSSKIFTSLAGSSIATLTILIRQISGRKRSSSLLEKLKSYWCRLQIKI